MTNAPTKATRPDPSVPKAQAAAHYASVAELIEEHEDNAVPIM